jgi:hypothetical protein
LIGNVFHAVCGSWFKCWVWASIRFKENVQPLSYGLAEVNKLKPVSFDWKHDFMPNGTHQIGFIAEDVAPIIPEVIGYDSHGQIMNLDYPKLTAVLAKSIQELNLKVEQIASTSPASASGGGSLFDSLKAIGVSIVDGILQAKEFIADKITTKQLCIEDVCVNRDQLKALLDQHGIGQPPATPPPSPALDATPLPTPTPSPTPMPTPAANQSPATPAPGATATQTPTADTAATSTASAGN